MEKRIKGEIIFACSFIRIFTKTAFFVRFSIDIPKKICGIQNQLEFLSCSIFHEINLDESEFIFFVGLK